MFWFKIDALRFALLGGCAAAIPVMSTAEETTDLQPLEEVVVLAPYGVGVEATLVPANVQRAAAQQIERSHSLDLTAFMNRFFGSANINDAQNNPLQPDFNFRGFTASPLLGLPQGLAVYQNGVRINEPFGDTINWDLIALSAVDSVQLLAGAQPVFGLNTLGGALSLKMKNGFSYGGRQVEAQGGSFDRRAAAIQSGGNDGRWGYYANVDYFEEDGWRDYSQSRALRAFAAVGVRDEDWSADLSAAYADTELRGNGASPVELLAIDRAQVFTHPDLTENTQMQVILEGAFELSERARLSANAYYRDLDTDTFNGDGTIFEECDFGDEEFLVEEDFTDLDGDGECSDADGDISLVFDSQGVPIEAEFQGRELDAVNNLSRRRQESYGVSTQLDWRSPLRNGGNQLTLGAAYNEGRSSFDSVVEAASLLENRATSRTGIFAQELNTDVWSEVVNASVYFADTVALSRRFAITLSGRYNETRIRLLDRTGETPELNGSHSFSRFNPAAGATFSPSSALTMYASYGESARAPSPVELACASEDAPCNLPNAFLADPPLDQVVAKSFEVGFRGVFGAGLHWRLGGFRTINQDDILFQTTGGPQANVGFFDNVGDTKRAGVEFGLSQQRARVSWSVDYSFIDAVFHDAFTVNSPNHPVFDDDPGSSRIVGDDKLAVPSGASIPGIPQHQANFGVDVAVTDRWMLGADVVLRSGVHLRGDEANLLRRTDGYAILNLRGEYRIGSALTVFLRIENALDEDYETFGLLGEPDEVFPNFSDPRFLGAGAPFGAWIGVKARL
ncbi:MAG TPA: TonB-dependent receptor [Steroidobacter sp.]|nr:TonB-dependent receptor [Steroidobacter sp.]